jgi:hypothetical protein
MTNKAIDIDKMLLDVRSDEYGDSGNYNTEKLKRAIQAEITKANIELLEWLYRKSEVIGVGYAVVREKHIIDKIAELQSTEGE